MRILSRVVLAFVALLSSVPAFAADYTKALVKTEEPIVLKGADGSVLALNNGPASLSVRNYGFFYGDGEIIVTTAEGSVRIVIPRSSFQKRWQFEADANVTGQAVHIRGWNSSRVFVEEPREVVAGCVVNSYPNLNTPDNVKIRLEGEDFLKTYIPTRPNFCKNYDPNQLCLGTQRVLKQAKVTTELYVVEFLDPVDGRLIGRIEAESEIPLVNDKVIKELSPCS